MFLALVLVPFGNFAHGQERIVDAQFQTLYSRDSLTGTAFAVDMGPLPGPRPQLVRVYYRMVHADGTAHRGHGDVQLTD